MTGEEELDPNEFGSMEELLAAEKAAEERFNNQLKNNRSVELMEEQPINDVPKNRIPISLGEEYELTCQGLGEKGDGVFKKDGFVIFVPNTVTDKEYVIRITRLLPKVGFGEIVREA